MKFYRENPNFYEYLRKIKEETFKKEGRWSGCYWVTTYTTKNGEIWELWEDLDYGVFYSLEKIS